MLRSLPLVSLAVLGLLAAPVVQADIQLSTYAALPPPELALDSAASQMVQDEAGNLYGAGMTGGLPVVYKVAASGGITLLHVFPAGTALPLSRDADGSLHGAVGNADGSGVLYRITAAGDYSVLATIPAGAQVCAPLGTLLHASDGNYYGCARGNQGLNLATFPPAPVLPCVYRVSAAGEVSVVAQFDRSYMYGSGGGLVEGADGAFYGATNTDASFATGMKIFRVTTAGALSTVATLDLQSATMATGGPMVVAADGSLYGALAAGGKPGNTLGGFFHGKIDGSGWAFSSVTNGWTPTALTVAADGQIYSALYSAPGILGGTVVSIAPDLTQTQVAAFDTTPMRFPRALSADLLHGGFNGVMSDGGKWNLGGIFHVGASGDFTSVEDFHATQSEGLPCKLSFAADGTAYGTRQNGTANGLGEVFRIATDGTYSSVGRLPDSSPVQVLVGQDGKLYGISNSRYQGGRSLFFRMELTGEVTVIKSFEDSAPDFFIQLPSGDFWGYTQGFSGESEIFKIDAAGAYTTMRTFNSSSEGRPLCMAYRKRDGYIYGTTTQGNNTWGSIFRLSLTGTKTTMYSFTVYGAYIQKLIVGSDGSMYGTTQIGGVSSSSLAGYIFRYIPEAGGLTLLHEMGAGEGYSPTDLTEGADGRLYVATAGGDFSGGTVFSCTKAGLAGRSLHHFNPQAGFPSALVNGPGGDVFGLVNANSSSVPVTDGVNDRVFRLHVDSTPTASDKWLEAEGLTGGSFGDDDGDGISNLMEYATGTDPLVRNSSPVRVDSGVITPGTLSVIPDNDGTVTFARRKDLPQGDLRLVLEASTDLTHWALYPALPEESKPIASDDRLEVFRFKTARYTSYTFFRLRLAKP